MIRRASPLALALTLLPTGAAGGVPCQDAPHDSPQPAEDPRPVRQPLPTAEAIAQLPPDGGPEFNRLVFEQSPYLLQHARNPVDWYPWGPEAFARAAAEDRPIFLSVGYSTCHWCHVMEHESFEDEEVAALLNQHFVCVKVDREERPDVDNVYMTVVQAMTGHGGWPMTVVLTPDKQPFFAGTYFPKQGRGQRPGMMQLVPALSDAWRTQREGVLESARRITEHVAKLSGGAPGEALDASHLELATTQLAQRFDALHGGFGMAPKFPVPHNLRHLLRQHDRTNDPRTLRMVVETLHAMARGGIRDHVGHGFHRYSTDREWLVPHFEKMLYDQALLTMAYVEAWQVTGDAELRVTAESVLTYVLRDLTDPAGGFTSAEDADSEGEEGLFYLWTLEELRGLLSEEDLRLATLVWGLTPEGNFRDEATGVRTGRNILHRTQGLPELAAAVGLEEDRLRERLEAIRARLFEVRERREHPLKDDKVLTDWNGLMIAAMAKAGRAFDEPRYVVAATRAADFVRAELLDGDGRPLKRWRQGEAAHRGMLEDHAFLAWGLLELYEASGDPRHLATSLRLVDLALEHFWDAEGGGFFLTPDDGEALIVRAKEVYDGAQPSGNSVLAYVMARLAHSTGRTELEDRAWDVVRAFSGQVAQNPSQFTQLAMALDLLLGPTSEVVVAGDPQAEDTRAMLRALDRTFLPRTVLLHRGLEEDAGALGPLAPYVVDQRARDGRATAYVCRDFTCSAPTHDVQQALRSLRGEPTTTGSQED